MDHKEQVINYILYDIKLEEAMENSKKIRELSKALRRVKAKNTILTVFTVAYILAIINELIDHREKIRDLRKALEEMKTSKGE